MTHQDLTEQQNFISSAIFQFKTIALIGIRFFKNLFAPARKFKNDRQLICDPVIAFSESELWNLQDNKENWILTAGKVENLRIAARKLNGLEIKSNEVFSFWRHIGNPNYGQGYVIGREIREGCIVPTIGGGLCQISNALYDAALNANFEIIERHKHTKVIQGSLAEQDRDATVKWNYLDLRFKSSYDFRIEVELSSDKLVVVFKSRQKSTKPLDRNFNARQSNKLNDCYSCGNFACFKHPDRSSIKKEIDITTFILDEKWPELDNYVKSVAKSADYFIVPLKKNSFIKTDRYSWTAMNTGVIKTTALQGVYRALKLRYSSNSKNNTFELSLNLDGEIARAAAKQIPISSSHLIVSQNLLPFIYEMGALGGRTYDVLMTRLPIEKLHERLDFAYSKHPESNTLNDFRASKHLIEIENKALTKSRNIITTHSEIAEIFNHKVVKLNWQIPPATNVKLSGAKVLFPASAVGRKGAYEIRKVARELNLQLVVVGTTLEGNDFWEGMKVERFTGNFDEISLVVYPTFIEHQPRQILKAIS
jgi:hypothetical protein